MHKYLSFILSHWLRVLHIVLLVVSVSIILFPQERTETIRLVFKMLFYIECSAFTLRGWKKGYLRATPQEMYQKIRITRERISTGSLERWCIAISWVAAVILAFS
jgi:hypothetical protein